MLAERRVFLSSNSTSGPGKSANTVNTRSGNNVFCHDLSVQVLVDSSGLWEGARKYIWKFMGQDEWTLADGTIVNVNRIHVK